MKATVEASDFADKTVHWEVNSGGSDVIINEKTGGGIDVTINEKTGVLTIGNNAKATTYTVKAVSNGDPEKKGSATITVR